MSRPSKNQRKNCVELVCPHCQAAQWEPQLAVSTFCRTCGQHFSIHKGKAVEPRKTQRLVIPKQPGPPPKAKARPRRSPATPSPAQETPLFSRLQLPSLRGLTERIYLRAGPATGRSAAEAPATRAVTCFDCNHTHDVSRAATSSLCPSCGAYVSLEDVHIRAHLRKKIATQGDVFIHKKSSLQASSISCRNLRVEGSVSGKIRATGEVNFLSSSKIVGSFQCARLFVARRCQIVFLQPVRVETMEIHGEITGDVYCSGRVVVSRQGAIHGELLAKSLSIAPGGTLDGAFTICRDEQHARTAADQAEERLRASGSGDTPDLPGDLIDGGLTSPA